MGSPAVDLRWLVLGTQQAPSRMYLFSSVCMSGSSATLAMSSWAVGAQVWRKPNTESASWLAMSSCEMPGTGLPLAPHQPRSSLHWSASTCVQQDPLLATSKIYLPGPPASGRLPLC